MNAGTTHIQSQATGTPPSVSTWQAALTITLAVILFALEALAPRTAIYAALVLFLIGVPHGAVERHPTRRGALERRLPTLGYTALYLVVSLLFFCSWLLGPVQTLAIFLALSAIHFGASEPRLKLAGLWVVLGSLVLFTDPTLAIFGTLTEANLLDLAGPARLLGIAAGGALAVQAVIRRDYLYGALLLGMFCLLGPISAVALYYFAIHSLREWREVHALRGGLIPMITLYAPFSLPVLIGGAAMIFAVQEGWVDITIAAGLAMAIAAPHMAPFERWVAASRDAAIP